MTSITPINIGVKFDSESTLMMKVKPATSMLKIIRAYCEAKSLDERSLRFLFDGNRIADNATVDSLDLEEGDW
jgi:hypothetical protein